jgi:hypothetical protein
MVSKSSAKTRRLTGCPSPSRHSEGQEWQEALTIGCCRSAIAAVLEAHLAPCTFWAAFCGPRKARTWPCHAMPRWTRPDPSILPPPHLTSQPPCTTLPASTRVEDLGGETGPIHTTPQAPGLPGRLSPSEHGRRPVTTPLPRSSDPPHSPATRFPWIILLSFPSILI